MELAVIDEFEFENKNYVAAAKITGDMSASDICDALMEQMKTIEVDAITSKEGVPMKWDENGMVDKAPKAVIITDGAYKAM